MEILPQKVPELNTAPSTKKPSMNQLLYHSLLQGLIKEIKYMQTQQKKAADKLKKSEKGQ